MMKLRDHAFAVLCVLSVMHVMPSYAEHSSRSDGSALCGKEELKQHNYTYCKIEQEPLFYYETLDKNKGERKRGEIINLTLPEGGDGGPFSNKHYYLHTASNELVDLGKFEIRIPSWTISHIKDSLKVHKSNSYHDLDISEFAKQKHYVLVNGELARHVDGKYPFKGSITVYDRKRYEGSFTFADGIYSWQEAVDMCVEQHLSNPDKKYDNHRLLENSINIDDAGYYYLCTIAEAEIETQNTFNEYYYRLAFEKENKQGTIFIGKTMAVPN